MNHIQNVFSKKKQNFFRLTPFRIKFNLLKKKKIDFMLNIKFDECLSNLSAQNFLEQILIKKLRVKHIITGFDFVFGNKQTGNTDLIRKYSEKTGKFEFSVVPELKKNNSEVSSSLIRSFLRAGFVTKASYLLGRDWTVVSRVVSGDKKAREIGFKTANLKINEYCNLMHGVYFVKVKILNYKKKSFFFGIANYGIKPTFSNKSPLLEIHIFDFNDFIYGQKIEVVFLQFIREEKKFESVEKLKDQIIKDINLIKNNELFKNN